MQTTNIKTINGIKLAACNAGITAGKRDDLALIALTDAATIAVRLTQNAFAAAPIQVCRDHLSQQSQFLLINAGNANAGNGEPGVKATLATCAAVAESANCIQEKVLPFSTGVIGEAFPAEKIVNALPGLYSQLDANNWSQVAKAIMTTDTVAKLSSQSLLIDGVEVNIIGITKGSGMIKPNMATMLAFIALDIALPQTVLDQIMDEAVGNSFNCISVDGDTSTNDACVLIASGDKAIDTQKAANLQALQTAINTVFMDLATQIIKDAEGATKFITIDIEAATNRQEAKTVAYTIAESPLVKTAFYASDPNWGRILAAIGRADIEQLDINQIDIFLDQYCLFTQGARLQDYDEAVATTIMQQDEITIRIVLHRGDANVRIWTSDLSHQYITINAEYRT